MCAIFLHCREIWRQVCRISREYPWQQSSETRVLCEGSGVTEFARVLLFYTRVN